MTIPKVSIIMPAYNSQKYIAEAAASVINQTYANWELIVIDDGSKDETLSVLRALQSQDSRIRLYQNQRNMGVAATRNRAISLARGEWIAFLDSDDRWAFEKLEKQLSLAEARKEAEFIFTGSRFMDEYGRFFKWIMTAPESVTYKKLLKQNVIPCSSVLISKRRLGEHRMQTDSASIHEDFALWLEILKEGGAAYGVDEPLLIYRISSKSKSGNKIKSAIMTYRTYLRSGIGRISVLYYMAFYLFNGFVKYRSLYKSGCVK